MDLSISYRLPKRVVELAKEFNPKIRPRDGAIDGNIMSIDSEEMIDSIEGNTTVLSRTNFPLIRLIFKLTSKGIKANIQGNDIGKRFLWRLSCWNPDTVEDFRTSVQSWRDLVCEKLKENKRPSERIQDEAQSLLLMANEASNVGDIKKNIKRCFKASKNTDQVTLSTVHKAKGLEWDNVMLLDDTFKVGKNEEENNIRYVALTRAKENLTFVSGSV